MAKKIQPTEIVIIRHGSTKLNSEDRIRGWSEIPLDAHGKREAKSLGEKLKDSDIHCLIASDLDRTQETAAIISSITGIPFEKVTKDFRPWHLGEFTGQPTEKVHPLMAEFAREYPDDKIKGGESFNTFKERFLDGLFKIKKQYPGQRIGIVTHHRGDRIFAAWKAKGFPKSKEVDIDVFLRKGIEPGEHCKPVKLIISP